MKHNRLFAGLVILLSVPAMAQTSFDAAHLYGRELLGTARYVAMGGAMGALGSDASVISQNPAGIGTYHQSDFNATLSFAGSQSVTSPLLTASNPGQEGNFMFYSKNRKSELSCSADMISVILCGGENNSPAYLNFGFVYRRLNNVDYDLDYIDSYSNGNDDEILREFRDHRTAKVNAFDFNLSANFEDIVYLGTTMEILSTDVSSTGYFYDYYNRKTNSDRFYSENKWSVSQGHGINMSLGVIVRPVPVLRIAAALKTPTRFGQSMDYEDNLYVCNEPDLDGDFYASGTDYRFTSPWSSSLGIGLTAGSTAIDIECEKHYTERSALYYDGLQLDAQGGCQYKNFATFRAGVETNVDKFSFRCGLCHNGSMFKENARPYLTDTGFNDSRSEFQLVRPTTSNYVSAGIGYCSAPDMLNTQFYFDMAFVHGAQNQEVCANEASLSNKDITSAFTESEPVVDYKYRSNRLMFTVGWCF